MARQARRRVQAQVPAAPQQPFRETASDVFIASSMPFVSAGIYGRMGRGPAPPGRTAVGPAVSALAYGNSAVTYDQRGALAHRPRSGQGNSTFYDTGPFNESPYGSVSGRQDRRAVTPRGGDGPQLSVPLWQHGRLIARDRHIIGNQGRVTSSATEQRTGGTPNPEADGPPRMAYRMFNRSLSWQMGTDSTRGLDNGQFHASVMAGSRKFPLGTQGDEWSKVYGGTPGLANYRSYGERGSKYAGAPLPRVKAEPGGPYRFNTLLAEGEPGDGPQRVYGGLPWGLHSPTVPDGQMTKGVLANRFKQVKPPWVNRPNNSKRAGQSWSQSMVTLAGHQAVQLKSTPPIRQPGMNSRWLGT